MVSSYFNCLKVVLLTGLLCCLAENAALAGTPPTAVTVYMLNGKLTKGLVDAETDDVHLVIRRESPNVLLRTRVPWMSVSIVTAGESVLSVEPFCFPGIHLGPFLIRSIHCLAVLLSE